MTEENALEMFVAGLVLDPNSQAPIIVLKDVSGEYALPIWIGVAEATSIASALKDVELPRPMTHDLMYEAFIKAGIDIQRVVITELKDATYYAELVLAQGDHIILLDSRPSDAIAIALRAEAPIFVNETVLNQAKVAFVVEDDQGEALGEVVGEDETEEEISEASSAVKESLSMVEKDFNTINKDDWDKILSDLDPDDFKYKM